MGFCDPFALITPMWLLIWSDHWPRFSLINNIIVYFCPIRPSLTWTFSATTTVGVTTSAVAGAGPEALFWNDVHAEAIDDRPDIVADFTVFVTWYFSFNSAALFAADFERQKINDYVVQAGTKEF